MKVGVALKKYAPLLTAGKSEAEIREALSKDEANYPAEHINQIYEALVKQKGETGEQKPPIDPPADSEGSGPKPEENANPEDQEPPASENQNSGEGSKPPVDEAPKEYIFLVKGGFRDRDNWERQYLNGEDVSGFDPERLERLIEANVVEKVVKS